MSAVLDQLRRPWLASLVLFVVFVVIWQLLTGDAASGTAGVDPEYAKLAGQSATGQQTAAIPSPLAVARRAQELLVEAVASVEREADHYAGKLGILADQTYGQDALNAATGRGWWIGRPVELPGSNPLQFEHGRSIGTNLISWPQEHVAKCLVFYHPDDAINARAKLTQ